MEMTIKNCHGCQYLRDCLRHCLKEEETQMDLHKQYCFDHLHRWLRCLCDREEKYESTISAFNVLCIAVAREK